MIAHAQSAEQQNQSRNWQAEFLAMMPDISRHAKITFRHLDPEGRSEAVQEVLVNAMIAYVRLVECGKVALAYPSALARFAVAQFRAGRRVGMKMNVKDVLSPYAQRQKGIRVESLDRRDRVLGTWCEVLVEDKNAGPAETAAARLDFAAWLDSLTRRDRKIAEVLSAGSATSEVAKQFQVSPGRISQMRRELLGSWQKFQGEYQDASDNECRRQP